MRAQSLVKMQRSNYLDGVVMGMVVMALWVMILTEVAKW